MTKPAPIQPRDATAPRLPLFPRIAAAVRAYRAECARPMTDADRDWLQRW